MKLINTKQRFGSVAKILHWGIALLIIAQFAMIYYKHYMLPNKDPLGFVIVREFHKPIGVVILLLVLVRIIWRLANVQPEYDSAIPVLERTVAKIVHYCLYLTMVIMPISGVIMSLAAGYNIDLFGIYKIAGFAATNQPLANVAFTVHTYCSYIMLGIIVLHIAGAYFNHFVNKNNILTRMLF